MKKKKSAKQNNSLSVVAEPNEYFKKELTRALDSQRVRAEPRTEFYLVNLLTQFMAAENLYVRDEIGTSREEVLALLLHRALAAVDSAAKKHDLRRLGDVSLYTAGFFGESLSRKLVDVDYYIGMGRSAYSNLARLQRNDFKEVFAELSEQFHRFVDVLTEMSYAARTMDTQNILRLYEVWLKTRSKHAEKSLRNAGIIPNKLLKSEWQ